MIFERFLIVVLFIFLRKRGSGSCCSKFNNNSSLGRRTSFKFSI